MNPVRTAAKAIIVRDAEILLIENQDAEGQVWYCLPGGGQMNGETLIDALLRECREEIGCPVTVGRLLFVRDYIAKNHEFASIETDGGHQLELMFECSLLGAAQPHCGSGKDSHQVGVRWLPLMDLQNAPFYPRTLRPHLSKIHVITTTYLGDVN
jgi:8-oxo-dGTP diphosphatase